MPGRGGGVGARGCGYKRATWQALVVMELYSVWMYQCQYLAYDIVPQFYKLLLLEEI